MRILLDMDGVLADFVEGACRVHGVTEVEILPHWPAGEFDLHGPIGAATGRPLTAEDFWAPIHADVGYWSSLRETPWCRELIDLVRATTDDWYIATSPSRSDLCIPEKRAWLHRVLGVEWFDRMIPMPHKELLAKPGVCLIDDYDRNCQRFVKAGGHAITVPRHWNSMSHMKDDPMLFVRTALDSWVRNRRLEYYESH